MIAIDTNVLVRILVNDPSAVDQCQLARDLVKSHEKIWVCRIVIVETILILENLIQHSLIEEVALNQAIAENLARVKLP